ncbi:hypothetical protein NP493_1720g00072 [Ridgeia piscesae]|uniref:Uncharacterized protein n=1 Tax=Ridgeia piscesae TaxID=27915 RepID=A0AAD9N6Y3_RIDPI|nr:hypothetical protein NP493_1720g00072 [Ridgeia piscesae]
MIPTRKQFPGGWTREYGGYLTTSHHQHHRATFYCMDEAPEVIEGAGGDENVLSESPCALTCIVCTK